MRSAMVLRRLTRVGVASVTMCAAVLLAGCGERNVGASASSEQSASSSASAARRASSATANATESASTVSVPAEKAIFEALRVPAGVSAGPLTAQELRWRSQLAGGARQGTLSAPERALWDGLTMHNNMRVRAIITASIGPLPAWPIADVVDRRQGPDRASFSPAAQAWAAERYAGIEMANTVATEIASRLTRYPVRDSADAQQRILATFHTLDHDALLAQYDGTRRATSISTGETQHVHVVMANGDDLRVDATGPMVVRNHVPWFGGGRLSGNAYQLTFAASASDTQGVTSDRGIDTGSGANQRTGADASVK